MQTVTAILTTYNSESFLQRTLDSVLNQEGKGELFELELIVVDDCSTDSTQRILGENKIDFLSTEKNSGGPNQGRNIGLAKATGDYIIILDHDDEWHGNRIMAQLKFADKAPIITCAHTLLMDNGRIRDLSRDFEFRQYENDVTFRHKISKTLDKQATYLGSIMYHNSLKDILFEEHFGQIDFDWVARLFHGNHSLELGESLYDRHVEGSNLSLNRTYRMRDYYYSLMFLEDYEKQYPRETRNGRKKINGSRARYHYLMNEMKSARRYFLRSRINLKTILFYLSSYVGHRLVKKHFHFFG